MTRFFAMSKLLKVFAVLGVAVAFAIPGTASAHGHSRVFLGFNFGAPAYYYPPPAYYYPPPVYYAPPPPVVYYAPPPVMQAPVIQPSAAPQNCRTYNGDATIDASGQPFYGTACVGPDGRWHITQ
jgi:hypothetical protein